MIVHDTKEKNKKNKKMIEQLKSPRR